MVARREDGRECVNKDESGVCVKMCMGMCIWVYYVYMGACVKMCTWMSLCMCIWLYVLKCIFVCLCV